MDGQIDRGETVVKRDVPLTQAKTPKADKQKQHKRDRNLKTCKTKALRVKNGLLSRGFSDF